MLRRSLSLASVFIPTQKLILSAIRPSSQWWHYRLGHPTNEVVLCVLRKNNLACFSSYSSKTVCDACLRAKDHQLPYSTSTSQSTAPLDLVYSDVWGSAINSFGNKKYYISFIDDYSKFMWIYLIHRKFEAFQFFKEFQTLVELMLNHKIITMQTDWGGEYERLNSFFVLLELLIMCLVLMPTNRTVSQNKNIVTSWRWGSPFLPQPLCH
jgi:hypothetical protein